MKRILTIVSVLSIVMASSAMAEDYGWSLSFSDTDPNVQAANVPATTPHSVYLWMACTQADGMSAAEFSAVFPAGFFGHGFTPLNGVLNAGDANNLLLAVGGCPVGPFLAGQFGPYLDFTGAGGAWCLVASPTGNNVTVDCDPVSPVANANAIVGCATNGNVACNTGACGTVSVEDSSWGSIKTLYR
ncbi:MAG: hypothetical protein DHS20C21_05520 [Gemmatimonadota bacterium]|nr:MAG: hypothetical protein DHS20C21_05520 [Gemmatimonadota bacterium]